jgi:hypothetical protein
MSSRPATTSNSPDTFATGEGHVGNCRSLSGQYGGDRCAPAPPELAIAISSMVATRCAPAPPELAIAISSMVATRCAPAPPELAIATSGSLDFSSGVLSGKDLA